MNAPEEREEKEKKRLNWIRRYSNQR